MNKQPLPEFSPLHYLLLLLLLLLATVAGPVCNWLFPSLTGSIWATLFPPLVGCYILLLLFRQLGILQLPNIAYVSAFLAPLSALGFYQQILH